MKLRWKDGIAILAGSAVVALTLSLGNWQSRRASEKAELEAAMQARESLPPVVLTGEPLSLDALKYRRVVARGIWMPELSVYLDNRPLAGGVGYAVVTPLLLAPERAVLVERGWVEKHPEHEGVPPEVEFPAGTVEIAGIAAPNVGKFMNLGGATPQRLGIVWPNLDLEHYRALSGLDIPPYVILQTSASPDQLRRDRVRPASAIDKHRGYAFQWYALSLLAAVLTVYFGSKRVFGSHSPSPRG